MLRAVVLFPDEHVGWIRGAFAKGLQRMKRGDIGAVISTSPPESTHIVAARLRRSTDVPWIADFRDPWGFSHLRDPTPMNYLHRIVEGRTIRRADALVTVTRPWAERFRALYPSLRVHSIPNGSEEELPSASCSPDPSVFRLVYTGKLDLRQQSPGIVFDAVATACAGGHIDGDRLRIAFHCYGTPEQAVREAAARSGLGTKFEWAGPLSSAKSLAVQRTADVLLIFGWQRDPGCVPAKLFDYLGSGRRILLVGRTDSEVASILRACGRVEAVESAEACRETLTRWFAEWREKGALSAGGDPDAVAQHAFRYRVDEYDRLLTELGAARHS